jgi:hypothetical protein
MRAFVIASMLCLPLTSPCFAGDVSGKGPNGGKVADAANMHVEFLSKGADVFVYTYDHDNKAVPSAGMTGRAIVQEKGKTATVNLAPDETNRLSGRLEAPLGTGARVVISLTPKNGKPVQARYTAN